MKIELSEEQVGLILDGLNALAEAAESENRATTDPEIRGMNDAVLRDTAELYEHIANYKKEENADQQGVCPLCGGELKYTDNEQMDDGGVYHWICTSCEATGKEGYNQVFDGHHYEVRDADGAEIPGRNY